MAVLIIDNSTEDLEDLTFLMNLGGYYQLEIVNSIQEGYKLLGIDDAGDKSEQNQYDLIIFDIYMDVEDGIEACKKIKSTPYLKDIPLIVVTENLKFDDMLRVFEIGVADYISKPLKNKIEMIPRVNAVLKLKEEMETRKAREKDLLEMTVLLEESKRKLKSTLAKLKELATIDGLTGVANRRYFDAFIHREWKIAVRKKTEIVIMIADIDYFKPYNDIYGHQKGDECLRAFSTALKRVLKRPADFIARYGGEEFVVVLPETDEVGATILGEYMKKSVEQLKIPHTGSKVSEYLTFSMGIACTIPEIGSNSAALISWADKALYMAKNKGRNRYIVYDDQHDKQ